MGARPPIFWISFTHADADHHYYYHAMSRSSNVLFHYNLCDQKHSSLCRFPTAALHTCFTGVISKVLYSSSQGFETTAAALKTTKTNLMVVKTELVNPQIHSDSSSGKHECTYKILQSIFVPFLLFHWKSGNFNLLVALE